MATRIEKIFRTNTINLTNSILNEILFCQSIIEDAPKKPEFSDMFVLAHKNITKSICDFYKKNEITDEEIRVAVTRGNTKCK